MNITTSNGIRPDISILLVTYNHEMYVEQAIRSIIMQEGDFTAEIVVADDASTDRTQDILDQYKDVIRMVRQPSNVGVGMNVRHGIMSCRGEFVAFLEGDDFWTSKEKLQLQLAHLRHNPSHALVHHTVMYYDEAMKVCTKTFPPENRRKNYPNGLLLAKTNFIQTCSVVCRANILKEVPNKIFTLTAIDWPLCAMMTQEYGIGYVNVEMAIYRIHKGGVWSTATPLKKVIEARRMAAMMASMCLRYQRKSWVQLYQWAVVRQLERGYYRYTLDASSALVWLLITEMLRTNYRDPWWCVQLLARTMTKVFNKSVIR